MTRAQHSEKGQGRPMDSLLLFAAFLIVYLALQLVILPKLGVST